MLLWPERQPWSLQGWALLRAGLGLGFPHLQVTGVLCPARAAPSEPGPGAREQALWGQNDLLALAVGPEAPEQETPQNRGRGRGGVRGSPACASPAQSPRGAAPPAASGRPTLALTPPFLPSSKSDYISPLDDLAFDMYQDPEVAQIIRRLDERKREAVRQERYDHAKKLKQAIADLHKVPPEKRLLPACDRGSEGCGAQRGFRGILAVPPRADGGVSAHSRGLSATCTPRWQETEALRGQQQQAAGPAPCSPSFPLKLSLYLALCFRWASGWAGTRWRSAVPWRRRTMTWPRRRSGRWSSTASACTSSCSCTTWQAPSWWVRPRAPAWP